LFFKEPVQIIIHKTDRYSAKFQWESPKKKATQWSKYIVCLRHGKRRDNVH